MTWMSTCTQLHLLITVHLSPSTFPPPTYPLPTSHLPQHPPHPTQFCFTGGVIEADLQFPGRHDTGGLWPAFWLLGNLGRATFESSTNLMWPWSYETCNRDLQNAQEISGCDVTSHYSLQPGIGRGATEIDIVEVMPGPAGKLPICKNGVQRPYSSMTLQVTRHPCIPPTSLYLISHLSLLLTLLTPHLAPLTPPFTSHLSHHPSPLTCILISPHPPHPTPGRPRHPRRSQAPLRRTAPRVGVHMVQEPHLRGGHEHQPVLLRDIPGSHQVRGAHRTVRQGVVPVRCDLEYDDDHGGLLQDVEEVPAGMAAGGGRWVVGDDD
jgi:hypothetical protein